MNDNTAPETGNAAETELLSAVADIEPEENGAENDTDTGETKGVTSPVRHRRNHRRRNIAIASVIAAVVVGKVVRMEPFGAFVDIGRGIVALLPTEYISAARIRLMLLKS